MEDIHAFYKNMVSRHHNIMSKGKKACPLKINHVGISK